MKAENIDLSSYPSSYYRLNGVSLVVFKYSFFFNDFYDSHINVYSPPNVPQHSKDTQRVLSLLIIIYVISLTCVNTFITSNHIYISHEDKYNHKSNS